MAGSPFRPRPRYGAKSIGEAAIGQFGVLQWERARTELKDKKIKDNLIALLSKTYSQIGPTFAKRCLKGMTEQVCGAGFGSGWGRDAGQRCPQGASFAPP